MFAAIGRFSYRHRRLVLGLWVVAFVAGLGAATRLPHELKGGGFTDPKAPAQQALETLQQRLHTGLSTLDIVATGDGLAATSPQFQAQLAQTLAGLTPRTVPGLRTVQTYATSGDKTLISKDGTAAMAVLVFDVQSEQVQGELKTIRANLRRSGLRTYLTGEPAVYEAISDLSASDLRKAESYALPFALIVLVLVFGSLVAASLPVIGGAFAVSVTLGAMYLIAPHYDLSIFVMNVASMLGLAVGIDYSLFIVGRFREELGRGVTVGEAVEQTVANAGRAVFFSGVAVIVGLLGLMSFRYMSLRSMGIGGSVVVLFSVLAALTLLPALLGVLGHRVDSLRVLGRRGVESGFWRRWSDWVMAHPVVVLIGTVLVIFALAGPVLRITVNVPTATELPRSQEARQGFDIISARFDRARLSPNEALLTWAGGTQDPFAPANLQKLYAYGQELQLSGVASVTSIVTMPGIHSPQAAAAFWQAVRTAGSPAAAASVPPGSPGLPAPTPQQLATAKALAAHSTAPGAVLFSVVPTTQPDLPAGRAVARRIGDLPPPAGTTLHLAGLSAGVDGFVRAVYSRFPWVIAFVLGVTYLVLLLLLRSVLLPLKAVIVNTLSILASYGALVFIFQYGHLHSLLGFQTQGYVDATLPVIMFCTIFGVSMDYEVFLLTRIREAWLQTHDNRHSVGTGLTRTGSIITSAALIIVIVAGSFALTSVVVTKAVGVGLAVAVAVDATIIRVLLVPAAMRLLGDWNWWIPRWLERILPHVE
jgi:putative drug exporter of the RND superfamily